MNKQAKRQNYPQSSAGHQNTQNESQLPVTCGHKEGVLHLKKYDNKKKCIFSEGQWFNPPEFERFGLKDRNKRWRISILCKGIPLKKLIEDGFLSSINFKKSKVQDAQKKKSPGRLKQHETNEKINDSQAVDDDDDGVDKSVFDSPTIPVTCGSDSGILHKCRFAKGRWGKCIRTENSWLSPEDFIRLNKPNGTWRKDIVSHGIPLGKLIMKRVLIQHMINCLCEICKEQDQHQENDGTRCFVCDSEGDLVCCDECPRAFHSHCHIPATDGGSPGSRWSCTFCVMRNIEDPSQKTEQEVLSTPVSQYTLHCQCLLLQLLHESMTDPCTKVPGYSENICGPMMLGRVKLNLENNHYQTVQEFVSDIEQIFNNRSTTSRDHDSSRMTSRLKEAFKKEFESVFKLL